MAPAALAFSPSTTPPGSARPRTVNMPHPDKSEDQSGASVRHKSGLFYIEQLRFIAKALRGQAAQELKDGELLNLRPLTDAGGYIFLAGREGLLQNIVDLETIAPE